MKVVFPRRRDRPECPECGRAFDEVGRVAQAPDEISYIHRIESDATGGLKVVEWCVEGGDDNPRLHDDYTLEAFA